MTFTMATPDCSGHCCDASEHVWPEKPGNGEEIGRRQKQTSNRKFKSCPFQIMRTMTDFLEWLFIFLPEASIPCELTWVYLCGSHNYMEKLTEISTSSYSTVISWTFLMSRKQMKDVFAEASTAPINVTHIRDILSCINSLALCGCGSDSPCAIVIFVLMSLWIVHICNWPHGIFFWDWGKDDRSDNLMKVIDWHWKMSQLAVHHERSRPPTWAKVWLRKIALSDLVSAGRSKKRQ